MKVEVLSFNNGFFSRYSCHSDVPIHFDDDDLDDNNEDNGGGGVSWTYSNHLMSSNMCHLQYTDALDQGQIANFSAFVWKIDDKKKNVKRIKYFPDFGSCLQLREEKVFSVTATYVSSSFVVVTIEAHDVSLLRVLNDEGELLRSVHLDGKINEFFGFFTHENVLFVESEYMDEVEVSYSYGLMALFDLEDLLKPEQNNMPMLKIYPELMQEKGFHLTDHTSISSITIVEGDETKNKKKPKIRVIKLDIWAVV